MSESLSRFDRRTREAERLIAASEGEHLIPVFGHSLLLVAVGGFGRRELFPFSDIDLLVLAPRIPDSRPERDALNHFQRKLWDAGLRMSQSVRTLDEVCLLDDQDPERTVALLDARVLSGSPALRAQLDEKLPRFLSAKRKAIDKHLVRMARARHHKFQNTIYHLEPDIKEAPGGLRDAHLLRWLSSVPSIPHDAQVHLHALRFSLHDRAGRDANLLTFDAQEELSSDPARLMRDYYRAARDIHRAALAALEKAEGPPSNLLAQFRDWRSRLSTTEFTVARDRVFLRQSGDPDPARKLRLFAFIARHGIGLSDDAAARIAASLPRLAQYALSWPELEPILAGPHTARTLRAMHATGALTALLPEFRLIDCLVIRDFNHRYTVDEHTLLTIEQLEHLDPRFEELARESSGLPLLRLALLGHDLGKGVDEPTPHEVASVQITDRICRRLGLSDADRETVLFLIAHHLDLSVLMTTRDVSDPQVARAAAESIGTLERLKLLALMTYADISAVRPEAMSPWRRDQLWRTYSLLAAEFLREHEDLRIESPSSPWMQGLPVRYLRTHDAASQSLHARLLQEAATIEIASHLTRLGGDSHWQLTIAARDRAGLFAGLTGVLAGFGFNILQAEAFANTGGFALDTFVFEDPIHTLALNPPEVDRLRDSLRRAVLGKLDVPALLRGRPKSKPRLRFEPYIRFDHETSAHATLLEYSAPDRPGLLHDIASCLAAAGINIDVVIIDTEASRARGTLYLTRAGEKIEKEACQLLTDELISLVS